MNPFDILTAITFGGLILTGLIADIRWNRSHR